MFCPAGWTSSSCHAKFLVHTNTLVNDLKFSHTWFKSGMDFALNDKNYATGWGLYTESKAMGSPRVLLYTQGAIRYDIGNQGPNLRDNRNLYIRDTLVWVNVIRFSYDTGGPNRPIRSQQTQLLASCWLRLQTF